MVKQINWKFVIWQIFLSIILIKPAVVSADELIIRALLPDPIEDETTEWILLENTSTATVSGQLCVSDGAGATKSFCWDSGIDPGTLYIHRADSKISLNNDLDWVELRLDDTLIDSSEPHQNITEGHIWTRLKDTWQAISWEDFSTRLLDGDWEIEADQAQTQTTPTPKSSPLVSPKPSSSPTPTPPSQGSQSDEPGKNSSGLDSSIQKTASKFPYQSLLQLPKLQSPMATFSAQLVTSSSAKLPEYPGLDAQTQQTLFRQWQRQALGGSYLLMMSGFCFELVSVPRLWRWYNDRRCIW